MKKYRSGFTLLETLVTIAILIAVCIFLYLNLFGQNNQAILTGVTNQVVATLRQAQSQSITQSGNTTWGVYFSNDPGDPYYDVFSGPLYLNSSVTGHYPLPPTIGYVTSTLPLGDHTAAVFSSITGMPAQSMTIGFYLVSNPAIKVFISINGIGEVSYTSTSICMPQQCGQLF